MNRFAAIFLILFFVVILGIGVMAIQEDVLLRGQASQTCPVPEIPSVSPCVEGASLQLVKNAEGCYTFACK